MIQTNIWIKICPFILLFCYLCLFDLAVLLFRFIWSCCFVIYVYLILLFCYLCLFDLAVLLFRFIWSCCFVI
jgi:hypothetical protein